MSEDMVERVAKAIHDHWQNGVKTWDETCLKLPGQANGFRDKARAAIEAMRTPTEAMENAGDNHAMSCAKVWIEMIDAALKEQTK